MNLAALARTFQLASQAFPIGGYSYSQGLESAIEHRVVVDERSALRWIRGVLDFSMLSFEVPMLRAMSAAWSRGDAAALNTLNEDCLATRESAEFRAATVQMGYSMRAVLRVLPDIPGATLASLESLEEPSLPCAWSAAAVAWGIDADESAMAYLWSWAENQVLAAVKTVPLGQSAGQRMLAELGTLVARALAAKPPGEDELSNFAPALAISSSVHENQYSRLFRS